MKIPAKHAPFPSFFHQICNHSSAKPYKIFCHAIAIITPLNISASLLIEIVYFILPYFFWLHLLFPLYHFFMLCSLLWKKCLQQKFSLLHNIALYIFSITFCSIWWLSSVLIASALVYNFSLYSLLPLFLFYNKSKSKHVSNRLQISTTQSVGNKRKPLFSLKK